MATIRKMRHWKQRFDPAADFICRRLMVWDGVSYDPGDVIPEGLASNRAKLRRFWEAQAIELAPPPEEPPADPTDDALEDVSADAPPDEEPPEDSYNIFDREDFDRVEMESREAPDEESAPQEPEKKRIKLTITGAD